jgi:muramoyltetrapeptide carboxypeptidase
MNRKKFLLSSLSLLGTSGIGALPVALEGGKKKKTVLRRPPCLRRGDTIGITCPAGYITPADTEPAVRQLEAWGFRVLLGNSVGKRDFTLGGTDEERRVDFQQMLDDRKIRAIMCARGGYGAVRIIDRLKFDRFLAHPKWIIGFSDITTLHCHIHANFGIASLHAKMCNSFPADIATATPGQLDGIESIRQCLAGETIVYNAPAHPGNRIGKASGVLIGGNLSILENLSGSRSDIHTDGKILFVEDTGEYLYNIDRMFWNLERSGKLRRLAGLVIGGFNIKKEESPDDTFGSDVVTIVNEKTGRYRYPVCFDFPVGHQKNNMALQCGVRHQLIVGENGTQLHSKKQ